MWRIRVLLILTVLMLAAAGPAMAAPLNLATVMVQPGDNLSLIAQIAGVSVDDLVAANNLSDPDLIYAGQPLRLPSGARRAAPSGRTITVQPGDNLSFIAAAEGVSVEALIAANNLSSADQIYVGQELTVPDSAPAADSPGILPFGAMWYPASTANYDPADRPNDHAIDTIVIHVTQGPFWATINAFQNPDFQVSAHYLVGRDGSIAKLVREGNVAWHAGNHAVNLRSIGVEHAGYVEDPSSFTDEMYAASARLVRDIAARYGIPLDRDHIIAHSEVPGAMRTDPGPYWDWDVYMRLLREG